VRRPFLLDVSYSVGNETRDLQPGDTMATPRGVVHGFSNPHGSLARALVINTPDIGAQYFREVAALTGSGGPPDRARLLAVMQSFGLVLLHPFEPCRRGWLSSAVISARMALSAMSLLPSATGASGLGLRLVDFEPQSEENPVPETARRVQVGDKFAREHRFTPQQVMDFSLGKNRFHGEVVFTEGHALSEMLHFCSTIAASANLGSRMLCLAEISALKLLLLVLEDGHRRFHAQEAELSIERFLSWDRVQDDLLVSARCFDEARDDLLSKAGALVTWKHGNVAEVGAVRAVGQGPTRADEAALVVYEALEHAVEEHLA
jgi:hypothetical protein